MLTHEFLHVLFAARTVFGPDLGTREFDATFKAVEAQTFAASTAAGGRGAFQTKWTDQDYSDSTGYEAVIRAAIVELNPPAFYSSTVKPGIDRFWNETVPSWGKK